MGDEELLLGLFPFGLLKDARMEGLFSLIGILHF